MQGSSAWRMSLSIGPYTYSTSALLGEGAYGQVFRGHRTDNVSEIVAVKRILADKLRSGELEIIRALRSPFIVGVLDVMVDSEWAFIVMEIMHGTLDDHLQAVHKVRSPGTLLGTMPTNFLEMSRAQSSPPRVRAENLSTITDSLARGYAHLNENDVMHRDIKPQNVLVSYVVSDDEVAACFAKGEEPLISCVKLSDFGSCRGSGATLSNVCGTLSYMAPEVGANLMEENGYGSQVDMWSMGCVLYECINGQPPFDEPALCRLFLKTATALNGDYAFYKAPTLSIDPSRAQFYDSLITRLLEVDAGRRMQPHEFVHAVDTLSVEKCPTSLSPMSSLSFRHSQSAHQLHARVPPSPPPLGRMASFNANMTALLWNVADLLQDYLAVDGNTAEFSRMANKKHRNR